MAHPGAVFDLQYRCNGIKQGIAITSSNGSIKLNISQYPPEFIGSDYEFTFVRKASLEIPIAIRPFGAHPNVFSFRHINLTGWPLLKCGYESVSEGVNVTISSSSNIAFSISSTFDSVRGSFEWKCTDSRGLPSPWYLFAISSDPEDSPQENPEHCNPNSTIKVLQSKPRPFVLSVIKPIPGALYTLKFNSDLGMIKMENGNLVPIKQSVLLNDPNADHASPFLPLFYDPYVQALGWDRIQYRFESNKDEFRGMGSRFPPVRYRPSSSMPAAKCSITRLDLSRQCETMTMMVGPNERFYRPSRPAEP